MVRILNGPDHLKTENHLNMENYQPSKYLTCLVFEPPLNLNGPPSHLTLPFEY